MRSGSVLSVISSAMCAFLSILQTDCTNFINMTVKQKGTDLGVNRSTYI